MIGKYNRSVILTYIGIAAALVGINSAAIYHPGTRYMQGAMICLMLAGICDLFDGTIARRCKRDLEEKAFGIQIDSLADVVASLVCPAVIGMALTKELGYFSMVILTLYVLAGVIRLAWFNITTQVDSVRNYYEGLPVTYMALILPSLYIIVQLINRSCNEILAQSIFSSLSMTYMQLIFLMSYLIVGFLFIAPLKVPKPKKMAYITFPILAVLEMGFIILLDL